MPISWEPVSVEPVKTPDGRVTVPEEVITSMERNKLGLKGQPPRTTYTYTYTYMYNMYMDVLIHAYSVHVHVYVSCEYTCSYYRAT